MRIHRATTTEALENVSSSEGFHIETSSILKAFTLAVSAFTSIHGE
jgi:hypothetical protein